MKLAQIVITRIDENTLKLLTFNGKECVTSEPVAEKDAPRLIAEAIARLHAR